MYDCCDSAEAWENHLFAETETPNPSYLFVFVVFVIVHGFPTSDIVALFLVYDYLSDAAENMKCSILCDNTWEK